jgi:RNA polymerase sigma-70 factor (ECF subfamily)
MDQRHGRHVRYLDVGLGMGDADAAEIHAVYRSESRRLVGYAKWLLGGNLADAEDVVDEAFGDLCRRWSDLRTLDEPIQRAWLRRVVRNKAISAYRRQRSTIVVDPLGDARRLDRATGDDQAHVLLARELLDQCLAVIQSLPSHLRLAIVLRAEGLTSGEIGEQLGVDSSTVRGYWAKVIQELHAKVGPVLRILDDELAEDGEGSA